jgi:hypothetical protein
MDNSKKPTEKVTNEEKIAICEKYNDYLRLINLFGNNVMLLKKLNQFTEALGLHRSYFIFKNKWRTW